MQFVDSKCLNSDCIYMKHPCYNYCCFSCEVIDLEYNALKYMLDVKHISDINEKIMNVLNISKYNDEYKSILYHALHAQYYRKKIYIQFRKNIVNKYEIVLYINKLRKELYSLHIEIDKLKYIHDALRSYYPNHFNNIDADNKQKILEMKKLYDNYCVILTTTHTSPKLYTDELNRMNVDLDNMFNKLNKIQKMR